MLETEMFLKYQETKEIELRNEIIEKYLYMVDILIRKYLNKGVEYDDLYQVASMALISAVERFDPSKGFEFSSFATPTIIGEIKKHFRDKAWSMKVPRRIKEISTKVRPAKEKLLSELGRMPTVAEIAKELDSTQEEILEVLDGSMAYSTLSLNQTFNDLGEDGESLAFEKYTAVEDKGYDRIEYGEMIKAVLRDLSDTNRYIFKKRFIEDKSQMEIAKELGVSQMTVSRAEKKIKERFSEEAAKSA